MGVRKIVLPDHIAEDPVIHETRLVRLDGAWTMCGNYFGIRAHGSTTGYAYGWKGVLVNLPTTCLWCVAKGWQ